ncbi:MAG: potassium transporter [Deltaproteobacteria bacterium]|jgi:hypothetical protein|nr:potassium transporter [Deltaproteobacteria bacterium]
MKTYWIIGGGYFGQRSAQSIRQKEADSKILLVDKQSSICLQMERQGFETVCTEGIRYLETHLVDRNHPDWIIPAIPVHVAYEWLKSKLLNRFNVTPIPIPNQLKAILPNPIQSNSAEIYVSNADFICPENCSEPDEICTHTGLPRPRILNDYLQKLQYEEFRSVIVCSQQLLPGVGGYEPKALYRALTQIEKSRDQILLATACRCHGVLNAFELSSLGK